MSLTTDQKRPASTTRPQPHAGVASRGLEWLWQHLEDVCHPQVLDCGSVRQATVDALMRRGAKLYVADLLSPVQRGDPAFWDRKGKQPIFLLDHFMAQIPKISPGSLSAIFCWHLLDLLPHNSLPGLAGRLWSYLQNSGVLFCLLREPYLTLGAKTRWWPETLKTLGADWEGVQPFLHPAITNREMERLVPAATIKTFLTRAGRREVLAIK